MCVTEKLCQAMRPGKILAVQAGLFRTAVMAETAQGTCCGIAATLRNPEFEHTRQPAVQSPGHLLEYSSLELAGLVHSNSHTEVAIGLATINALLPPLPERWVELHAEDYLLQHGAQKNVVVVGHFPFINKLKGYARNLWVLELKPREDDLPAEKAPEVIPQADFLALTATTLINKTFEGLMALCRPETKVMMLGPSTPLSPVLFDFGIDVLSGTVITDPPMAMLSIAQGATLHQLRQAGYAQFVTLQKEP